MSDEKRDELEPQVNTEPLDDADDSIEITDEELKKVSGGARGGHVEDKGDKAEAK